MLVNAAAFVTCRSASVVACLLSYATDAVSLPVCLPFSISVTVYVTVDVWPSYAIPVLSASVGFVSFTLNVYVPDLVNTRSPAPKVAERVASPAISTLVVRSPVSSESVAFLWVTTLFLTASLVASSAGVRVKSNASLVSHARPVNVFCTLTGADVAWVTV